MAKRDGGQSLAVALYDRLRREILNGEVRPGQRLEPAELSMACDVSLGVVREALGLLGAKDLVRIDRNRGFHVMPLELGELDDLTEARVINEGAALRLSVQRGDISWESEVLAAHHRLASKPMTLASGNAVLLNICNRLSDAAEVYRAWSAEATARISRDVTAEHRGLLDADSGFAVFSVSDAEATDHTL